MALIFMDGMDSYAATSEIPNRYTLGSQTAAPVLQVTGSPFSSQCINAQGSSTTLVTYGMTKTITLNSAPTLPQFNFGFWFKQQIVPAPCNFVTTTGGTVLLVINASGGFTISNILGAGATAVTQSICDNKWHWIETSVQFGNSAGLVTRVYVDGALYGSSTGTSSASNISTTTLSFILNATNANYSYIDDIVIWDNSGTGTGVVNTFPLGKQRITTTKPATNGTTTQFTNVGSAGSNAAAVAGGWSNTNSVTGVAGSTDLYNVNSLSYTPAGVTAVAVTYKAASQSSTTAPAVITPKLATNTGAPVVSGTAVTLPNSGAPTTVVFQQQWPTDANGNVWTPASINTMQIGQSGS